MELIVKYLNDGLTDTEREELFAWKSATKENNSLFESLTNEKQLLKGLQEIHAVNKERGRSKIEKALEDRAAHPLHRNNRYMYLKAAAVLLGLLGIVTLVLTIPWNKRTQEITTDAQKQMVDARIGLTLADGTTIKLDSANNGVIARQGNVEIIKQDSMINYRVLQEESAAKAENFMNILKLGRQDKRLLVFPDGSRVWVNAQSALRYPTIFSNSGRSVDLSGEGYFEVSRKGQTPFFVHAQKATIEVLGTHFNVAAYTDDNIVTTTLVQGVVKVTDGQESKTILPRQQVVFFDTGRATVNENINPDKFVAWKDGNFLFTNDTIETVVKQIARWYGLQPDIRVRDTSHIEAISLSKSLPIETVLKVLNSMKIVEFEKNGNRIIAKPKSKP